MLNFTTISKQEFLNNYWQKKPCVIKNAIESFELPLTAQELGGLSMEEGVESRMVFENQGSEQPWQLKRGPFTDEDFAALPQSHWTLLVQGVDRIIPEVAALREHFSFIPSWRIDDVMISFAPEHGSVGPHYDNYDVFLYQAQGSRKWMLTTKDCNEQNYLEDVELRIMKKFAVEQEIILEQGDCLYLPPHVGHHGVSLGDDCLTFSFGYRSYRDQELWDSFADHLSEAERKQQLYIDPSWEALQGAGQITPAAIAQAKSLMQNMLDDEQLLRQWFGRFATSLDQGAEQMLPLELQDNEILESHQFKLQLKQANALVRDNVCRFAYNESADGELSFYANSCLIECKGVDAKLIKLIANTPYITMDKLNGLLDSEANIAFLYQLWKLQWLQSI